MSSTGGCLWGGSSVPQHLECASVQQPVGLRALGKGWLVRLAGILPGLLSGANSSAILLFFYVKGSLEGLCLALSYRPARSL